MISPDLRVEGFDVTSWTHLLGLFMPNLEDRIHREPAASDDPDAPAEHGDESPDQRPRTGTLLVVDDAERRILLARHTFEGALPSLVGESSATDLRKLAHDHGAKRIVVIREGTMDGLADELAEGLAYEPDLPRRGYVSQWLVLLRALKRAMEVGNVRIWPNPLANVPVPSTRMLERASNLLVPDDHAMVAALFDRGRPYTAVVVRRRHGLIDLVAGPDLLASWAGPLGGDWRRDHRVLSRAVEQHVAPVHLGLFAEVSALRRALRSGEPGEWARQIAVRDLVIDPMPRPVKLAVGADAVRGLSHVSSGVLGGLDLWQAAKPLLKQVRERWTEIRTVSDELGFDPLVVLAALLRREDDEEEP